MSHKNYPIRNERRDFLKKMATGAAAMGLSMVAPPFTMGATPNSGKHEDSDPDKWFDKVQGKHRVVFDVMKPNGILPFVWPRVFQFSNAATGTPATDLGIVVVLRHEAIVFAMESRLWEKYKFGEMHDIQDPKTKAPAIRNMFWKPDPGDFKVPGVGNVDIGIDQLQESGVMFCVCNMALTVNSAAVAEKMGQDPAAVKSDWVAGILPGIQIVPSGIWAVGRAQEHQCAYCFAE
ncbi:MAG: twin-arginine translocation signal domain-containing protein [Bacteroidota bacterium]|nr:twin-arginine translocation signal domain-containing protein [Bacteroidota bacterium]